MGGVLRFTVEFQAPDETGQIVAQVREVPGALSVGYSRQEARANVLDALLLMLSPEPGEKPTEDTLDLQLTGAAMVKALHAAAPIDDEPDDPAAELAEARTQAARGDSVSLADLVAEAEAGYDVDALKARRGQRNLPAVDGDPPAS